MGHTHAPESAPDTNLLFRCQFDVPYFTSQKNAKVVRYRGSRPFIGSTAKSTSARNFLLSQLQVFARDANISQPFDMEMRLLLTFCLESFYNKKGKIHRRSGDLDNLLAAPIDAMVKSGIISDDSLLTSIEARKIHSITGNNILTIELFAQNTGGYSDSYATEEHP